MDRREEIARSLSASLARPTDTNRQIGSASLGLEEAFRRLSAATRAISFQSWHPQR